MAIAALLTDFGQRDYYVAAMRGVLLSLAPGCNPVDVGHEVEPGDIEGGAFLLQAAAPWFPAGTVFLVVVDPGVGSDRRILAAEAEGRFLVGPDNGVLSPGLDAAVHSVERGDLFLGGPGATFHGRDRFAPVAAWLLRGEPISELGPAIEDPVRLDLPKPRRSPDRLEGRIVHVDRFGNLVSDLPAEWLGDQPFEARIGEHLCRRRASHYRELEPGEIAVLTGSLGTLELAARDQDLARRWSLARGKTLHIKLR